MWRSEYDEDALWEIFSRVYSIYGKDVCKVFVDQNISQSYEKDGTYYIPAKWKDGEAKRFYEQYDIASYVKVCFSNVASNISAWVDYSSGGHSIIFPTGKSYSRERICKLIDHEVGTHFVKNENAYRGVTVRSPWYLEDEEGIATTNEDAVVILDTNDIFAGDPTVHHLSTFVAEHYTYDQTYTILKAYFRMMEYSEEDAAKEAKKRTERVKRFHAYDRSGANRKDVVYWRGKKKVADFLARASVEELQKRRDLMYQGKFSEIDIDSIPTLLWDEKVIYQMPL